MLAVVQVVSHKQSDGDPRAAATGKMRVAPEKRPLPQGVAHALVKRQFRAVFLNGGTE